MSKRDDQVQSMRQTTNNQRRRWFEQIDFSWRRKIPVVLQTEVSECGLACLAMIAQSHGYDIDLASLRQKFPVGVRGVTLVHLAAIADHIGLSGRPLRLDPEELLQLRMPCILHWNLNHFVVLQSANRKEIVISDPAIGLIRMSYSDIDRHFTGIALELEPSASFLRRRERQKFEFSSLLGRAVGIKRSAVQILLLALALEVCALLAPFFTQWIFDNVLVTLDTSLLGLILIGYGILLFTQSLMGMAQSWVALYLSTHLNLQWASSLFGHLLRLPVTWFEKRSLGDIVSRFGAIDAIQHTLTNTFFESVIDGTMGIATLAMMLIYSAKLTAISFIGFTFYVLLRLVTYTPYRRAGQESIVLRAKEHTLFLESMRAMQAIKLFGHESDRKIRWRNAKVDTVNSELRIYKLDILFSFIQQFLRSADTLATLGIGAYSVMGRSLSVGMLLAFLAYKHDLARRLDSIVAKFFQFKLLHLQGERVGDIALSPPENIGQRRECTDITSYTLNIENISFQYSSYEHWQIRNVSLTIPQGSTVVLEGSSGSGKTTILKIILGLLTPQSGQIFLDGKSIASIGLRNYRQILGSVMQDDTLISGSILQNISFFAEKPDLDFVKKCAKLASVDTEIDLLPMAYQTLCGDMGNALSGGQRQRILIARALYKRPKILVLDEATSHLDPENEMAVLKNIKNMNITVFSIAHRPAHTDIADIVARVVNGEIIRIHKTSKFI